MFREEVTSEDRGLDQGINNGFLIALLVTGNQRKAEAAVLEGIEQWNVDEAKDESLLLAIAEAAVSPRQSHLENRSPDCDSPDVSLPIELHRVLLLRPAIRYCFVLRVLAGLSREVCARMLHLQPCQLDQAVCAAAQLLALYSTG